MTNIQIYDGGYSDEQRLIDQAEAQAQAQAQAARQVAKDAVLTKLGLSADELAALLGA